MRELFRSIEAKHVFFSAVVLTVLNNLVWYDKCEKLQNTIAGMMQVCGIN